MGFSTRMCLPRLKRVARERVVRLRRRGNDDRVGALVVEHVADVGSEPGREREVRKRTPSSFINVANPPESITELLRRSPDVVLAPPSAADDGEIQVGVFGLRGHRPPKNRVSQSPEQIV